MYFLPMTTGASKAASYMIALAVARTNHRTATSKCIELLSFELGHAVASGSDGEET